MNVLACIKRVPATAGQITLTSDGQEIDTRYLGFTVSPHEECAVEEAVRLIETHGGSSTVLTLGPEAAIDQLRDAMALGVDRAILLLTDGREWDPVATAGAIVDAVRVQAAAGQSFDLLLFGNEAADTGDYQVPVRVAHALGLAWFTGVKSLAVVDGHAIARRQVEGGWESCELALPAVISLREGINLPRYPSLPGRLRAKKKDIECYQPAWVDGGLNKVRLRLPPAKEHRVEMLGQKGGEVAPQVVEVFQRLGLL